MSPHSLPSPARPLGFWEVGISSRPAYLECMSPFPWASWKVRTPQHFLWPSSCNSPARSISEKESSCFQKIMSGIWHYCGQGKQGFVHHVSTTQDRQDHEDDSVWACSIVASVGRGLVLGIWVVYQCLWRLTPRGWLNSCCTKCRAIMYFAASPAQPALDRQSGRQQMLYSKVNARTVYVITGKKILLVFTEFLYNRDRIKTHWQSWMASVYSALLPNKIEEFRVNSALNVAFTIDAAQKSLILTDSRPNLSFMPRHGLWRMPLR